MIKIFMWVKLDTKQTTLEVIDISVYGTGHEVMDYSKEFIGTVQMASGLVFHAFKDDVS